MQRRPRLYMLLLLWSTKVDTAVEEYLFLRGAHTVSTPPILEEAAGGRMMADFEDCQPPTQLSVDWKSRFGRVVELAVDAADVGSSTTADTQSRISRWHLIASSRYRVHEAEAPVALVDAPARPDDYCSIPVLLLWDDARGAGAASQRPEPRKMGDCVILATAAVGVAAIAVAVGRAVGGMRRAKDPKCRTFLAEVRYAPLVGRSGEGRGSAVDMDGVGAHLCGGDGACDHASVSRHYFVSLACRLCSAR